MGKASVREVTIPDNVEITVEPMAVRVKGMHGELSVPVSQAVSVSQNDNCLTIEPRTNGRVNRAIAGTIQSLLRNTVHGVRERWERKLTIVGVGYRARIEDNALVLQVGLTNPQKFPIPEDVAIETPSQTEIVVSGIDRQRVGQVAANIRAIKPPSVYKGKGIRYDGEYIKLKPTKGEKKEQ